MEENLQIPDILGANIKELRKKQGMTLRDMAAKTGLSAGFLSKIERSQSNPSIGNLQKICYVLNVTVDDLASPPQDGTAAEGGRAPNGKRDPGLLIRRDDRALIYNLSNVVKLETIFTESSSYKLEAMTLKGTKAEYVSSKHTHDELGIVSRGILSVVMSGTREYVLTEGDALLIPAGTEHTIRKVSKEDCVSYWFKALDGWEPQL